MVIELVDMKNMNTSLLKHVTTLLALEQHGSISRAAETLELTQSALTKALQRAEEDLGQALFTRHTRGVVPTTAGAIALAHARIIQNQCIETENKIGDLRNFPGVLRIGAGASFLDSLLPEAMAEVVTNFPTIEIKLKVESVVSLLDQIRSGDLDLLFISEPPGIGTTKDIRWTPLINDEMDIVARSDHPLTRKAEVEMTDLKQYGWVLGSQNDPQRTYLESVFRSKDMVSPKVTIECLSREVAIRTIQRSDLLTLVPNVRTHPEFSTLARIDCPALRWVRVAGIITREGFTPPSGGVSLLKRIAKLCQCTMR